MPTPLPPSRLFTASPVAGAVWTPDSAIVQDASFTPNAFYRAYLDSQNLAVQLHITQSLINGVIATWMVLDAGSAAVAPGDLVCLAGQTASTVTRITAGTLTAAGMVFGVAVSAATAGSPVRVAMRGWLPTSVTGLAAGASLYAIANTSSARIASTSSLAGGNFVVGTIDAAGNLLLNPQLLPVTGGTSSAPVAQRVKAGDASLQGVVFGVVFCDPGFGGGGGVTVLAPVAPPDGYPITLLDTTGTCSNTNKIGFTAGAATQASDPQNPGNFGVSGGTVFIVQKGDARTWYWDNTKAHWTLQ